MFKKGNPPPPHKVGCRCFRCTRKPNATSFKKGLIPWNKSGKFIECEVCGKKKWYKPKDIKRNKNFFCSRTCCCKYRIGKDTWNKGKKLYPHTLEQRMAKSVRQRGKNSHFWQGGKTKQSFLIRHSLKYRLWRNKVFKRDHYTCQFCGQIGGRLHADHIEPFSLFPKKRFLLSNGRTLCVECHEKTPTYLMKTHKTKKRFDNL